MMQGINITRTLSTKRKYVETAERDGVKKYYTIYLQILITNATSFYLEELIQINILRNVIQTYCNSYINLIFIN